METAEGQALDAKKNIPGSVLTKVHDGFVLNIQGLEGIIQVMKVTCKITGEVTEDQKRTEGTVLSNGERALTNAVKSRREKMIIKIRYHDLENSSWKILIKLGNIDEISTFMEDAEVTGEVIDQEVEETISKKADQIFETFADFQAWFKDNK